MELRGLKEAIAQGSKLWTDGSQLLIVVSDRPQDGGGEEGGVHLVGMTSGPGKNLRGR